MLNGGYWAGLKEFYETEYNGVMAGTKAEQYAEEMNRGDASFLQYDRPFDPYEIKTWIEDTAELIQNDYEYNNGEEDGQGTSELDEEFPNFWQYEGYEDQIASYFMHRDLDRFSMAIREENQDFIDEAIRLNWTEMLEEIPTVKDIFLF